MARPRPKGKKKLMSMEQRAARNMKMRLVSALSAVANERSGINPDMMLLPQNLNVTHDFEQWFEKDEEHPEGGAWIKRRRGRRTNNVYHTLFVAGTIDKHGKVAGDGLAIIYARSKGQQGSPDDGFRVQCERSDPHERARRKAEYGARFVDILRRIENTRYRRILRAITIDLVGGDGAGLVVGKRKEPDGARWRIVLSKTVGLIDDQAQSRAMKRAVEMLIPAKEAHDKEWPEMERRRKEALRKAA